MIKFSRLANNYCYRAAINLMYFSTMNTVPLTLMARDT